MAFHYPGNDPIKATEIWEAGALCSLTLINFSLLIL